MGNFAENLNLGNRFRPTPVLNVFITTRNGDPTDFGTGVNGIYF